MLYPLDNTNHFKNEGTKNMKHSFVLIQGSSASIRPSKFWSSTNSYPQVSFRANVLKETPQQAKTDARNSMLGCESCHQHLPAMWIWQSNFTFLRLSFLTCNTGIFSSTLKACLRVLSKIMHIKACEIALDDRLIFATTDSHFIFPQKSCTVLICGVLSTPSDGLMLTFSAHSLSGSFLAHFQATKGNTTLFGQIPRYSHYPTGLQNGNTPADVSPTVISLLLWLIQLSLTSQSLLDPSPQYPCIFQGSPEKKNKSNVYRDLF